MNEEDGIRLEEFRQLKKEIRGCGEYLIVGIDVAKEAHHAFFGTATGKTLVKRLVFCGAHHNAWSDCTRTVIDFCLRQVKQVFPFDITRAHIVADRVANDGALGIDDQG